MQNISWINLRVWFNETEKPLILNIYFHLDFQMGTLEVKNESFSSTNIEGNLIVVNW